MGYQMPDPAIAALIDQPGTPGVSADPAGKSLLLLVRPSMPPIDELAAQEYRLAGYRINPRTNGPSRAGYFTRIEWMPLTGGTPVPITGLPENARIGSPRWAPDGQHIAFTITEAEGISLWVAEIRTLKARRLTGAVVNAALTPSPFTWLPDGKSLLVREIMPNRKAVPEASTTPTGPVVMENSGQTAVIRTYQDLLANQRDEALFDYFAQATIVKYSIDGQKLAWEKTGIPASVMPSPDGQYVLVSWIERPYSYLVPAARFPITYEIRKTDGSLVREIARLPLAEAIPKGFDAVRTGPRQFSWRSDKGAELYWVEAQDGGDPAAKTEVRDRLFRMAAPFAGSPESLFTSKYRFAGITWGNDNLAMVAEYWWATRKTITSRFNPSKPDIAPEVWFDRSSEDRYGDPGDFATTTNASGWDVLLTDKKGTSLFLTGMGASEEGNRPFVDQISLKDRTVKRLWRSEGEYYEIPVRILDIESQLVLTRRESKTEAPNFFIRDLRKNTLSPITRFEHPYPSLKDSRNELITYARKDGVQLSAKVYYPAGYDPAKDGPRPVLMWAYPEEFKSAAAASQVNGSKNEFIQIFWASPLFWLARGYVVVEDFAMPIVGEGESEPNDQFVEQLTMNAEAIINKLVDMGVADRGRIAVGGHSYGAFMTANLLAHTRLFAAGIARSGAYNRTLTPFGFQSEERTFWDAPEVYATMSPFFQADKIKDPLLLIHGQADNNPGTFTLQSERLYQAMKALGGNVRLVLLPHESHGYQARESILHMLWEMDTFLEKTIGSKKP